MIDRWISSVPRWWISCHSEVKLHSNQVEPQVGLRIQRNEDTDTVCLMLWWGRFEHIVDRLVLSFFFGIMDFLRSECFGFYGAGAGYVWFLSIFSRPFHITSRVTWKKRMTKWYQVIWWYLMLRFAGSAGSKIQPVEGLRILARWVLGRWRMILLYRQFLNMYFVCS
jgi:hypothetical protein